MLLQNYMFRFARESTEIVYKPLVFYINTTFSEMHKFKPRNPLGEKHKNPATPKQP